MTLACPNATAHGQELSRKTGRPPKYTSPQEMPVAIEAYFEECDKAKRPYTVPGLALVSSTQ